MLTVKNRSDDRRQIMIHQPFGDYYGAWRAMEEMYREGIVSAIGVCNFDEARLLSKTAARYGKSTVQIILRWHIQRGVVVIPKSARKERMEENLNIWGFTLDSKDMDAIATMDIGHSEIINHCSACTAKALNATKIH